MSNYTTATRWTDSAAYKKASEGLQRLAEQAKNNKNQDLNNLNLNKRSLVPMRDPDRFQDLYNLNNLKAVGIPRVELFTDDAFVRALEWGFDEAMLQLCIGTYGKLKVKGLIHKISKLPELYFKPQYGPVVKQRGKLLNHELGKLKKQLEAHRKQAGGI